MHFKTLLLFILVSTFCNSQNRIQFQYDAYGNQIQRKICINCPARPANENSYKSAEDIEEKDFIDEIESIRISYYPNPVKEELYIKWNNVEGNKLVGIELYTLNGQVLKKIENLKSDELIILPFRDYAVGYYNLMLIYSNTESKLVKIIKQ